MIRIDKNKKILLDTDVIFHFFKGEQLSILHKIFTNKLYILQTVFKEVRSKNIRIQVENLLRYKFIYELDFTGQLDVLREYARLKKSFGPGESACMAYCKFHKDVLASSNLKDIKAYCEENDIQYLTTMDFIAEAYRTKILNEAECDEFIYDVISKGSRLPCRTVKEFIEKNQ